MKWRIETNLRWPRNRLSQWLSHHQSFNQWPQIWFTHALYITNCAKVLWIIYSRICDFNVTRLPEKGRFDHAFLIQYRGKWNCTFRQFSVRRTSLFCVYINLTYQMESFEYILVCKAFFKTFFFQWTVFFTMLTIYSNWLS